MIPPCHCVKCVRTSAADGVFIKEFIADKRMERMTLGDSVQRGTRITRADGAMGQMDAGSKGAIQGLSFLFM